MFTFEYRLYMDFGRGFALYSYDYDLNAKTYIDGKGFFKNFKKKAHDYDYLDNIASDPYSGKKHLENPEAEGYFYMILAKKIHLMFHRCLDAFFKGNLLIFVLCILIKVSDELSIDVLNERINIDLV
uniref:Uncharacterized protein n=1 Tax=Rhizophagus irregularis (strain DAOM 181602 / DAOM 197198 / MUCL 43194) TaxID=747089 RepID=U9TTS9_RHIID